MNINKIKEIVELNCPDDVKRSSIIRVLAEDEHIFVDLLEIARDKQQKDMEMMNAAALRISEALHFIENKCKPTPNKKGITREYLIEKTQELYRKFEKLKWL